MGCRRACVLHVTEECCYSCPGPYHPDAPLKEPLSAMIMPRLSEDGLTWKVEPGAVREQGQCEDELPVYDFE